nr:uncharacterized protein LOC109181161 [Ipomoea batatas]
MSKTSQPNTPGSLPDSEKPHESLQSRPASTTYAPHTVSNCDIFEFSADPVTNAGTNYDISVGLPHASSPSVPVISVPFSAPSQKGKCKRIEYISVPAKRKSVEPDDVVILSETAPRKKYGPSLPARMTRSRTGALSKPSSPVLSSPRPKPKVSKSSPTVSSPKATTSKVSKSPPILKAPKPATFQPMLLNDDLWHSWGTHFSRELLLEKAIDETDLIKNCNIISLLRTQNLLKSVQHIGHYSKWLTAEFYTNLLPESNIVVSHYFHQVFIRGQWYSFGPTQINSYFQRTTLDCRFDPDYDLLAGSLTHNQIGSWPNEGILATKLTTIYSVLLRLAATNWLPVVNPQTISRKMAVLLYKIRHMLDFDLGTLIYDHIMSFTKKKEFKVHLPFPCRIYGVLKAQGFEAYKNEHILENRGVYLFAERLTQSHHFDDRITLAASSPFPGSSNATGFSSAVPKYLEPPSLIAHRAHLRSLQAHLALVRSSISSLQDVCTGIENDMLIHRCEIDRLEVRHAALVARGELSGSDSDDATGSAASD